jgi:AraC-like DNA-binding protein/mannose-6-phosphate isomerase-like protein (cupin superfamily)
MDEAQEWRDHYVNKPYRKVYTSNELCIPGLAMAGWHYSHIAQAPMASHFHRDCIEITLVVKGNTVFSAEGKEYYLQGGDVFITEVNQPHDTGSYPVGVCEIYWFQIQTGEPLFLFLGESWSAALRRSLESLRAGILRGVDFSRKYLAEMFSLLCSGSSGEQYQGIAYLLNILYRIIGSRAGTQNAISADIQKAVDFIHNHLSDEIPLQRLADKAGLSLSRFKQKFYKQTGLSPRMFINAQKVEIARHLLLTGKTSITDTAFNLGFNSSTYFSTVFRKFTLVSPSEFIEKNKQIKQ